MSAPLRPSVLVGLAALGLTGLAAAPARAGDGTEPRAPVIWDDPGDPNDGPACMTIVDRSVDPVVHLDYSLLYEDTKKTADEVEDSRRHQFFAFCRHHSRQEFLPKWISEADVAAADAKGIVMIQPGPEDILDTAAAWQGCFVRMIPDDERRPITNAEAAKGVDWDTSDLPIGAYFVEGYNWHPVDNQWYTRDGVIKVVDSPDLAASPPAVAFDLDYYEFLGNEVYPVRGCASAVDGATVTVSWSFPDPIAWVPFAVDVPVDGESFEVEFVAPPETMGSSILLKVDVTDPMDRTSTAHANELLFVVDPSGLSTSGGDCDATFIKDPSCGETTGTTGVETSDTATETTAASAGSASTGEGSTGAATTTASQDDGDGSGCQCRSGRPTKLTGLSLLFALAVVGRRPGRRRGA